MLIALFVWIIAIFTFQVYDTFVSIKRNKIQQKNLTYTIISLIILANIPSLHENFVLSVIAVSVIVLIMLKLISLFTYINFLNRNES